MTRIVLLLHGIALSIAGIVAMSIAGRSIIPTILLISGVVLIALSLNLNRGKQIWHSTKEGVNALATTAVVLLIVGLINWLGIRYSVRWDLTENQVHTLSSQSQTLVAELEQPLKVIVFDRNLNPRLENLLENYRRYSKQFQFELINPEQEIGLAQQYGVQSLGETYLQYGDRQQKLSRNNAVLSETQLTNAIEKIKRDRPSNIYFLQGHGEASLELIEGGLAQLVKNLEDRGNTVRELNLASSGEIPNNADLIIIAGATRQLLAAEVSTLEQYLLAGGNLLLLLSPNTDLGITPLLQAWGIELDDRLIVDGSGEGKIMGFGPAVAIVNNYGNHPITASFDNGISLFPESRPLKILEQAEIETTPLVISDRQTWAESNLSSEEITFDSTQDLSGPLNMAIASIRQQHNPSRLVVFGSSTFATNGWFEQQLNGDILLNSIDWLLGKDLDTLAIRPQEPANRRLNLNLMQATIISWLAWRIMPLSALIAGIWFWWRRR